MNHDKTIKVTHIYAKNPDTYDVYFSTNKSISYLDRALANIQFITDEIELGAALSAIQNVQLLKQFFDNELTILPLSYTDYYVLDEYANWERNCSNADEIIYEFSHINPELRLTIIKTLQYEKELEEFYRSEGKK